MNYRTLHTILALILLTCCPHLRALKPVTNLWNYYLLPCKHTQTGTLQCLVTKKDNRLELIKNNFTGPAITPGTAKQINFDAIRTSAHEEMQKLGFAKTDYIYTVGHGDPNTQTVIHAFLVDPTKLMGSEFVWEDLATLAPVLQAARIGSEFINSVRAGSTNRYQRKTVYVDWDETKREIGFVKQNNTVTPQVLYEPTWYRLAEKNSSPYLVTSTAIKTTGSDTAEKPEDDTAFERLDLVFTQTPTDPKALLFATEDTEQAKKLARHWEQQQTMELTQRIPGMVTERTLKLFAQALANISAPKKTDKQKSPGQLIFDVIVTSSSLLEKPNDPVLKEQLKQEIIAVKANKTARAEFGAYPTKLITELGPYPSPEEKASFMRLRKILEIIDAADRTIFVKKDLQLLTQATQEDPGYLATGMQWAKSNADIIFGSLKIASKLLVGV